MKNTIKIKSKDIKQGLILHSKDNTGEVSHIIGDAIYIQWFMNDCDSYDQKGITDNCYQLTEDETIIIEVRGQKTNLQDFYFDMYNYNPKKKKMIEKIRGMKDDQIICVDENIIRMINNPYQQ